MKIVRSLILGSLLVAGSVSAQDFRFDLGPFSMQFGGPDILPAGHEHHRNMLNYPICYAIAQQKRIVFVVENRETVSPKEMKVVTKQLTVEPYAFGTSKEGKQLLQGNVTEDKQISEITIKYSEDTFAKENKERAENRDKSFYSGWFSSGKSKNIDIQRVSNLRVLDDSHFDAPKDYKGVQDDSMQVICQLPVKK